MSSDNMTFFRERETRSSTLIFRVTPSEKACISNLAQSEGKSVSQYMLYLIAEDFERKHNNTYNTPTMSDTFKSIPHAVADNANASFEDIGIDINGGDFPDNETNDDTMPSAHTSFEEIYNDNSGEFPVFPIAHDNADYSDVRKITDNCGFDF